jgi:hypothetical protein
MPATETLIKLEAALKTSGKEATILAYSGGVMAVEGWGYVCIDLKGLALPDGQLKILMDHKSTVDDLAGYGNARIKDNRELWVAGKILDTTEAGKKIIELSKEGVQFQASVGVMASRSEYIRAGEIIQVNGQTIKAEHDLSLIRSGILREVSLVLLGADDNTCAKIAAQKKGFFSGDSDMPVTKERIQEIRATIDRFAEIVPASELRKIEGSALENGWGVDETTKHCLQAMDLQKLRDSRPQAPTMINRGSVGVANPTKVLAAAALLMHGLQKTAEKHYDERTLQAAADLRINCALNLCSKALELNSQFVPSGQTEMIRAAFSTSALSSALADSATKELVEGYEATPATWRSIALIKPTKNFHPHSAIRGVLKDGLYKPIAENGEFKHGSLEDETYSYRSDTRGLMFSVDRKTIVNDDLGVIYDLMRTLGINGQRTINKVFWETIRNATGFFTEGHGNYITGGNTALGIDSLGLAVMRLREQQDGDGNPIGIIPKVLAVPPALEGKARQLLASMELHRTDDGAPTANPWKALNLQLEVEAHLGAAAGEGGSDVAWYLFGNKEVSPAVIVSFLNGMERPTVEVSDTDFNTLGQRFRAYLDFGCDMAEYRGAVKALGEA